MKIDKERHPAAAKVYTDYRALFPDTVEGAMTKELLLRHQAAKMQARTSCLLFAVRKKVPAVTGAAACSR